MTKFKYILSLLLLFKSLGLIAQGIGIHPENPWYFQYRSEPVVLIGGSDIDNIFQWTGTKLIDQLDLLVASKGNFLRNTISDRGDGNVYAFKQLSSGKYDLNQWNDEYWNRLDFFLKECSKRGIFSQMSLWDHFDIESAGFWNKHPWNPENNTNMEPGSWRNARDFYTTVNRNDSKGLAFQEKFIEKILSVTFKYDNVLYNINNESDETPEWENYWAAFVKQQAKLKGKDILVTTLQFDAANAVRHAMTYPELFDYVEISQNNQDSRGGRGKAHWDNLMNFRQMITSSDRGPMPMLNEKVYGGIDGKNLSAGTETEAIDRFWRNIFAGSAGSRFHRPAGDITPWGSGLNERVQRNLKSMDLLLQELDIFSCTPSNHLLVDRVPVASLMEAYACANIGKQYAVYFPNGRYTIALDPWVYLKQVRIKWLNVDRMEWSEEKIVDVQWEGGHGDWGYRGQIHLETPGNYACVALIQPVK